jgi:hypothetical protein
VEKYLIELSVDSSAEYHVGQSSTRNILSRVGIDYKRAKWYSCTSGSGVTFHTWAVLSTVEERAVLALLGAKIGRNLTAEAKIAAQTKLDALIKLVSTHMTTFSEDELACMNTAYTLTEKVQAITCLAK